MGKKISYVYENLFTFCWLFFTDKVHETIKCEREISNILFQITIEQKTKHDVDPAIRVKNPDINLEESGYYTGRTQPFPNEGLEEKYLSQSLKRPQTAYSVATEERVESWVTQSNQSPLRISPRSQSGATVDGNQSGQRRRTRSSEVSSLKSPSSTKGSSRRRWMGLFKISSTMSMLLLILRFHNVEKFVFLLWNYLYLTGKIAKKRSVEECILAI